MYQQPQPYNIGGSRTAAVSSVGLLGQVLGLTGVAFLITAATAYFVPNPPFGFSIGAMIAGFILIFAINGTRANAQLSMLLFYAFAALQGIWIAPVITHYVASLGSGVVFEAAATTGLGMLVIGGVAWVSSFDFRKLSMIAFGMLIALVLIGIVSIFVNFLHPATYSWATLVVFTLLMLIDFQRIRAGGDGNSPVQLALSIYLDGINFFMAILRLLGLRGRD
jgi:modulator of FtsH protease